MNTITDWARTWQIPDYVLADLRSRLGAMDPPQMPVLSMTEAGVQSRVRAQARRDGVYLWRNNVGAFHDAERNVHVRFGLANDSPQVNAVLKSADLIGIRPRVIQPADVGSLIGQFVSRECKRGDWRWSGTEREVAQQNWATLIASLGGDAEFVSHV